MVLDRLFVEYETDLMTKRFLLSQETVQIFVKLGRWFRCLILDFGTSILDHFQSHPILKITGQLAHKGLCAIKCKFRTVPSTFRKKFALCEHFALLGMVSINMSAT